MLKKHDKIGTNCNINLLDLTISIDKNKLEINILSKDTYTDYP